MTKKNVSLNIGLQFAYDNIGKNLKTLSDCLHEFTYDNEKKNLLGCFCTKGCQDEIDHSSLY